MRRANQGMRLVMHDRESELGNDSRKMEVVQKKKPILLRQLQNELKHLDQINDEDFEDNQDPYINDGILDRLQTISKEALKYDLKEIEKLCKLAIGKRILNIELKKKKDEHNSKLLKKEKIQMFFRQNQIKRYNYQSLIDWKLKQSTLIAKAYQNGKGFIESTSSYVEDYEQALLECDYIKTIKQVNKIFYKNYSTISSGPLSFTAILLKVVWIPIIIFICLALTLPFVSFLYEEVIIMSLLAIILIILFYISLRTFCDKPNENNQIQQSIADVMDLFEEINQNYQEKNKNIEWICDKDFMYLAVIFHDEFPSQNVH